MTLRSKLCAMVAVKLDSGQKFIILRIETGLQTTLNTYPIPTTLIQTGFPCIQNWRISGKSTGKSTVPKRISNTLSHRPLVNKKQAK